MYSNQSKREKIYVTVARYLGLVTKWPSHAIIVKGYTMDRVFINIHKSGMVASGKL